jgi:hypothetical protein
MYVTLACLCWCYETPLKVKVDSMKANAYGFKINYTGEK